MLGAFHLNGSRRRSRKCDLDSQQGERDRGSGYGVSHKVFSWVSLRRPHQTHIGPNTINFPKGQNDMVAPGATRAAASDVSVSSSIEA